MSTIRLRDRCCDDGVITGWASSPFDLRTTDTPASAPGRVIVVPAEVIAMLRTVLVLDTQLERLAFSARVVGDSILFEGSDDDLEELADAVAAEANHETNRTRQRRLDAAMDTIAQN